MEEYGERTTGTRDEHYNLISVLYHALHGADNCDHYAMDAEATGDERLAAFFREAQQAQVRIAERGKELLGIVESPPEFDVEESGPASVDRGDRKERQTTTGNSTGGGISPTSDMVRTSPDEDDLRGRGVPPMRSDEPRDEGLAR